jgi:hypothetical protein
MAYHGDVVDDDDEDILVCHPDGQQMNSAVLRTSFSKLKL